MIERRDKNGWGLWIENYDLLFQDKTDGMRRNPLARVLMRCNEAILTELLCDIGEVTVDN